MSFMYLAYIYLHLFYFYHEGSYCKIQLYVWSFFLTISNKPYTKTTQAKNQERERKIFCGEGEWRFVGI